ncbi:uncharacterized protein LOC111394528 [Olea europaea var. sylvestris]|uniref:uncharacterized protein LOC111394528 n=1 Tax=Olea europaea var. sylvestris TaxID=158386 RepID=UPI000C1D400A|nr:uncharacterized protein LOC111394528 [Olea europaea var. sylvestris]
MDCDVEFNWRMVGPFFFFFLNKLKAQMVRKPDHLPIYHRGRGPLTFNSTVHSTLLSLQQSVRTVQRPAVVVDFRISFPFPPNPILHFLLSNLLELYFFPQIQFLAGMVRGQLKWRDFEVEAKCFQSNSPFCCTRSNSSMTLAEKVSDVCEVEFDFVRNWAKGQC